MKSNFRTRVITILRFDRMVSRPSTPKLLSFGNPISISRIAFCNDDKTSPGSLKRILKSVLSIKNFFQISLFAKLSKNAKNVEGYYGVKSLFNGNLNFKPLPISKDYFPCTQASICRQQYDSALLGMHRQYYFYFNRRGTK